MLGKFAVSNPKHNNAAFITVQKKGVDKVLGSAGRNWQLEALRLKSSQFAAITAPCGSGKSTAQVALAIQDILLSDFSRLQLFVVPQVHIADGFFKGDGRPTTLQIKGKDYIVSVDASHNFCETSSLKALKKLLLTDRKHLAKLCKGNQLSGLFAMTSHAALASVWKKLSKSEKEKAIHNLHLRLDESHHVAAGKEQVDQNRIGAIVRHVVQSGDKTSRITMTTATMFRGDKRDIVSAELLSKFQHFSLDWLKHWRTIGIKDLFVNIAEFKHDPIAQVVKNIRKEKYEYHYIAIPPRTSGWRTKFADKSAGLSSLVKAIKAQWPTCRILDLVTPATQNANKMALLQEPKNAAEGEPKFDVVITCMLGREGTDWCPCSRLHVTYPEGSITLAVQTLGRLLRRFEGKKRAIVRYYYPTFPKPRNGMTKAEVLDDRKNALLVMTQVEEMFVPILFPLLPRDRDDSKGHHMGSLEMILGSQTYIHLKAEFLADAIEQGIMGSTGKEIAALVAQYIADYDVPKEYVADAEKTLQTILLRAASPRFRGINIAFVRQAGFEKLYEKLTLGDKTLVFRHGYTKMKQLRAIVQKAWDEWFVTAKKVKKLSDVDKHPGLKAWALMQKKKMAA